MEDAELFPPRRTAVPPRRERGFWQNPEKIKEYGNVRRRDFIAAAHSFFRVVESISMAYLLYKKRVY